MRSLYAASVTAISGNFRSSLLERLRDNLISQFGFPQSAAKNQRIYISRADAPRRHLRNERELLATLKSYEFNFALLNGKRLVDQIAMFRACRLLVGLHGAGLTNMLWMPKGGEVIEIRRRGDCRNNCYYVMASALGHRYSYLLADDAVAAQGTHSAELTLDVESLNRRLSLISE